MSADKKGLGEVDTQVQVWENATIQIAIDDRAAQVTITFDLGGKRNQQPNEDPKARTGTTGSNVDWERHVWQVRASALEMAKALGFADAARAQGIVVAGDDVLSKRFEESRRRSKATDAALDNARSRGHELANGLLARMIGQVPSS